MLGRFVLGCVGSGRVRSVGRARSVGQVRSGRVRLSRVGQVDRSVALADLWISLSGCVGFINACANGSSNSSSSSV
jgi:hypothetical protein